MTTLKTNEHGVILDLSAIARELQAEDPYSRNGQAARTLLRAPDMRIVLIALREGKRMSEHQANVTASVQILTGRVTMQVEGGAVELAAGQLLALEPGRVHDVHAEVDSTFLLTLGWPPVESAE